MTCKTVILGTYFSSRTFSRRWLKSLPFNGLTRVHLSAAGDSRDELRQWQVFLDAFLFPYQRSFLFSQDKLSAPDRGKEGETAVTYGFGDWVTALLAVLITYVQIGASVAGSPTSIFANSFARLFVLRILNYRRLEGIEDFGVVPWGRWKLVL